MNVFEVVKENVTARQAAEAYGLKVGRTGMACCPFHSDKSPSMKLDERYYCFGCGATGDAVDLTAKLFGIGLREAAVKLAEDFGLNYDSRQKPSIRPRIREPTPEQKYQKEENHCYKVLTDYFHLLREWEKKYAPKQPDEEWNPLFAEGNLYELDYQQHFQHIREVALPVGANRLIYESGMREIGPKKHFDSRPDKYFGEFVRYEMQPRDPELLQAAIRQEQRSREPARPGDFKEHLAALHTGLIEAEAQRIAADMKRLAAPNSPDKNHFMVEVSPYFTKLASSRDTDQLLAMLPYKSMHLSSVKDRFGIYALVDKKENRDRGIRKPRASVRKQLSETKQAASPKRAAARSKQHEMEV